MPFDVVSRLEEVGAIKHDGHFVLKSGRHASDYADFDHAFPHSGLKRDIADAIAAILPTGLQAIVAPAVGAIALLSPVATAIGRRSGKVPLEYWADKHDDGFIFERGDWKRELGSLKVAVIEDVITRVGRDSTLGSVVTLCEEAGAEVVTAVAILNRGNATPDTLQIPGFKQLALVEYDSWPAEDCARCDAHQPIVQVGHWETFLRVNSDFPTIAWHELPAGAPEKDEGE